MSSGFFYTPPLPPKKKNTGPPPLPIKNKNKKLNDDFDAQMIASSVSSIATLRNFSLQNDRPALPAKKSRETKSCQQSLQNPPLRSNKTQSYVPKVAASRPGEIKLSQIIGIKSTKKSSQTEAESLPDNFKKAINVTKSNISRKLSLRRETSNPFKRTGSKKKVPHPPQNETPSTRLSKFLDFSKIKLNFDNSSDPSERKKLNRSISYEPPKLKKKRDLRRSVSSPNKKYDPYKDLLLRRNLNRQNSVSVPVLHEDILQNAQVALRRRTTFSAATRIILTETLRLSGAFATPPAIDRPPLEGSESIYINSDSGSESDVDDDDGCRLRVPCAKRSGEDGEVGKELTLQRKNAIRHSGYSLLHSAVTDVR